MPAMTQTQSAPAAYTAREKSRAQIAAVLPCVAKMSDEQLEAFGLRPAAVAAVKAEAAPPSMLGGTSSGVSLTGLQVVARNAVLRFQSTLAPLEAFSTTYREDFVVPGKKGQIARLTVPIYDDKGEAAVDNFDAFSTRTDTGTVSEAEIVLHKVDEVITITARDLEQGVDIAKRIDVAAGKVARSILKAVLGSMIAGTAQGDNADVTIASLTIPAIGNEEGKFNFGYVNQTLTEAIQPRVNAVLLDSAHYGALKAANKDSLTAGDLDCDYCGKVDSLALPSGVCGFLTNRRGAGVGIVACKMLSGTRSYEQLQVDGINTPLGVASWFDEDNNCIRVWVGTYYGVAITDAAAIKPLVAPSS